MAQPDGMRVYITESRTSIDYGHHEVRLTLEAVLVGEHDMQQIRRLLMDAGSVLWLGPVPELAPRVPVPPKIAEEMLRRRIVLEQWRCMMNLLPVTSTLIEPLLLRVIAERWRKERRESEEAQAAVRELLEGGAAKRIQISYRQTKEPPGVEVWVYRGEGNYGAPGASPLGAILAVGFAKWHGPHTVWRKAGGVGAGQGVNNMGRPVAVCVKETVGDKYDLRRGLVVALGRAIRQALSEIVVAQRTPGLEPVPVLFPVTTAFADRV